MANRKHPKGMGAALFSGGAREGSYSQEISETAFELVKLTLISTSPVIMCYAMIKSLTSNHNVDEDTIHTAVRWLSRGTAIVLLVVYFFWVLFRRGTHKKTFQAADTRAANVLQGTKRHASPKRQVWLGASSAAAFVVAVFCCRYLVGSVDPLDLSSAPLHRHFIGSILLPLIIDFPNYIQSAELARRGHDVSLSVHLTYGAGMSNVLFTLPLMVIVGWASGHDLFLDFSPFDVSILAAAVWATSILLTGSSDYFRGFLYISLCVACAILCSLVGTDAGSDISSSRSPSTFTRTERFC